MASFVNKENENKPKVKITDQDGADQMGKKVKKKKNKKKLVGRIVLGVALVISAVVGSLAATAKWNLDNTLDMMDYDDSGTISKVDLSGLNLNYDSDFINILLVGVDGRAEIGENESSDDGRSDTCMIATMDLKNGQLKLTSILRDTFVNIPGYEYSQNTVSHKFNSAYQFGHQNGGIKGGIKLLYETIAKNFNIRVDGYAVVNFSAFEDAVDAVGGVEVTLTESEAYHLNNTNYIRKRKYRNVKVGKQTLNGCQALGYCRIRHGKNATKDAVYSLTGKANDYGRTERQRYVIEGIYKKMKAMSIDKWMSVAQNVLPNITTDIDNDTILSYMYSVLTMGTTTINQYRFPSDNHFTSNNGNLVPDSESNQLLYDFIYKKVVEEKKTSSTK